MYVLNKNIRFTSKIPIQIGYVSFETTENKKNNVKNENLFNSSLLNDLHFKLLDILHVVVNIKTKKDLKWYSTVQILFPVTYPYNRETVFNMGNYEEQQIIISFRDNSIVYDGMHTNNTHCLM